MPKDEQGSDQKGSATGGRDLIINMKRLKIDKRSLYQHDDISWLDCNDLKFVQNGLKSEKKKTVIKIKNIKKQSMDKWTIQVYQSTTKWQETGTCIYLKPITQPKRPTPCRERDHPLPHWKHCDCNVQELGLHVRPPYSLQEIDTDCVQ